MKLGRHLVAGGSALFWVGALVACWRLYSAPPIDNFVLSAVDDKVDIGDKLKLQYTFRIVRPCKASLSIAMNDGLEVVRTYHADLYATMNVAPGSDETVRAIKEVGLPNFTSPGKLRLDPSIDFVCNRVHRWWPLHIAYPSIKVEVVDKVTLVRIATVAELSQELGDVSRQVETLRDEVNKLKPIKKSELYIAGEQLLRDDSSEGKGSAPTANTPNPNLNGAAAVFLSRIPPLPERDSRFKQSVQPTPQIDAISSPKVETRNTWFNWEIHD